jgi:hypothetical protein
MRTQSEIEQVPPFVLVVEEEDPNGFRGTRRELAQTSSGFAVLGAVIFLTRGG